MPALGGSPTPYYLHLHVLRDLRVLIPFTLFKSEFQAIENFDPSQVMPNVWGVIRAFEIICRRLKFFLALGYSYLSMVPKPITKVVGWSYAPYQGENCSSPDENPIKITNTSFMRVGRRDCASISMVRTNGAHRFQLSWTRDPKIIILFEFDYLTLVE